MKVFIQNEAGSRTKHSHNEKSRFDRRSGRDEGVRRVEWPGGRQLEGRFSIRYPTAPQLLELAAAAGFARAEVLGGASMGLRPEVCVLRAVA